MYMKKGEFAFGAARINPMKAMELGLVYEALKEDYIKLLCCINISFFGTCRKGVKGSQTVGKQQICFRTPENSSRIDMV